MMSDNKHTAGEWPNRLTLRDSGIFADEGQRIYTTATGYGYEKCQYVRGDIADNMLAVLKAMIAWSEEPDPESKSARTAPLMKAWAAARAAIAKAEGN